MNNEIAKTNNQVAVTKNRDALASIAPEHQQIIKLALAPKISNMPALNCTDLMIDIFRDATTASGQVFDEDSGLYMANETYDWLIRLHPEVTIEEIRAAVRAGVYDEYGEYWGLNPKTYVFFVRSYLESEKRRVAAAAFESAKNKIPEPVRKLTVKDWKFMILQDYDLMKSDNQELIVFFPKKYIFVRRQGLLGLKSMESWHSWLLRAKNERVWTSTRQLAKKGEKTALSQFRNIYAEFEVSGTIPKDEFKRLVYGARKLRYLGFLEHMVRMGDENPLTEAFTPKTAK